MSSAGRAASSSGCVARPRGREIGLIGFAAQIRRSSLIGSYVMETAEHREPCESRGSRTVLGARGGEIPPRDSTKAADQSRQRFHPMSALPTILLQKSPRRSCRIKMRNNRIGVNGFLNQPCALIPDLESIMRARMRKIVLQHNLPIAAVSRCSKLSKRDLLDHLIDTHEKGHRHFKSEHLGGA